MSAGPGILERIVAGRQAQVAACQAALPLAEIRRRALAVPVQGGFARVLSRKGPGPVPLRVIAELKPASPSAGRLRDPFDTRGLAGDLVVAGAAALSVLTEPDHFQAEPDALARARQGAPRTPLLRKDFILAEWQVWEARLLGADAVLLMAALLPGARLAEMLSLTEAAGLEALVEAADPGEVARAVESGAGVIGVNARDLRDFTVDLERAIDLAGHLPRNVVKVAESGVGGPGDLARLAAAGFDAALVGTALMRASSPGRLLAAWLGARTPGEGTS